MARPATDPAIKAGDAVAKDFGFSLAEMGELLAVIDDATQRPGGIIAPASLKKFGLNVGDVRDIETRLKRGTVLATLRAGLATSEALKAAELATLRASGAARAAAPRAAAKSINPRRIVMRKAPDAAWQADSTPVPASELWQQELNLIAQAHGFAHYGAVQKPSRVAQPRDARWDMCAHLSKVHGWSNSRIARDFTRQDESSVRHGISVQGGFAQQVQAMEELLGPAFVPPQAQALPAASLVMYRYQKLLPDFEDLEDVMRDVALPQSVDETYNDVDGKRVLSPQGRKMVAITIREGLNRVRKI